MCGIAGFLGFGHLSTSDIDSTLRRMGNALEHRGPDDRGTWRDDSSQIALAHERLAIMDLSSAGRQPMRSHSGRYVIVYNGEIYNHKELRADLDRHSSGPNASGSPRWSGHSDTEVLLAGIDTWGVEKFLERADGMFAFALWDRQYRELTLVRDRLGEKPLYYGWQQGTFLFGSELKALRSHPSFKGKINHDAVVVLMRRGFITAPDSIYEGISKLSPGHLLRVRLSGRTGQAEPISYWTLRQSVINSQESPFSGTELEAADELERILRRVISNQLVADVPVGAFLSGGIDSSVVVALMQLESKTPVHTFTIGFEEQAFDEAGHAGAIADYLGTSHTQMYVSSKQALEVIPRLASIYDEPFGDPSQIPTVLIAELARRQIAVALSGDGGDELFAGYTRYTRALNVASALTSLPYPVRKSVSNAMRALPVTGWNRLASPIRRFMPAGLGNLGDKTHKLAGVMSYTNTYDLYSRLLAQDPDMSAAATQLPVQRSLSWGVDIVDGPLLQRMMLHDSVSYLPDDILYKVDRASMAASLETRIPLLDRQVIEFAWSLPMGFKFDGVKTKVVLRELLAKHLPRTMFERPKMGFAVPIDAWLRGPLHEWASDLLNRDTIRHQGLLSADYVDLRWRQHLSGERNWQYVIWNILMLQAWLQNVANT